MSHCVELRPSAIRGLAALGEPVRKRIAEQIDGLAHEPRPARSEALRGKLSGLRKLRIGDYRVSYEVDDDGRVITVWLIGHRSTFYKRANRDA